MEFVAKVLGIGVLVVVAAMLADLVAHPDGTGALINGITKLWSTSLNAALGKPT